MFLIHDRRSFNSYDIFIDKCELELFLFLFNFVSMIVARGFIQVCSFGKYLVVPKFQETVQNGLEIDSEMKHCHDLSLSPLWNHLDLQLLFVSLWGLLRFSVSKLSNVMRLVRYWTIFQTNRI